MLWRREVDPGARFDRIFRNSSERLDDSIKKLFAENAAKGVLKSGYTIRRTVAAIVETISAAISECLDSIAKTTDHLGGRRIVMLKALEDSLAVHLDDVEARAIDRISSIGLAKDAIHTKPLLEKARQQYLQTIQ